MAALRYLCGCGASFPATLRGAWDARLHAEHQGHGLRGLRTTEGLLRVPALEAARAQPKA